MADAPRRRARRRTPRAAAVRRSATAANTAPRKTSSGLPQLVYAQASPRSLGGVSLFDAGAVTAESAANFASDDATIRNAVGRLRSAGFQVLHESRTTVNIAGPPALYQRVFDTTLEAQERPVIKEQGRDDTATFVESMDTDMPGLIATAGTPFEDVLEGIAIEEPRYFFQNAFAPPVAYWHLDVPGDVSLGMNADKAHRGGITGRGVKVVMTDTGWFRHPYFVGRGYRSSPVVLGPSAANPNDDEVGHGTAESANIFAVAPDVDFTMVKLNFVNTIGAFNAAVQLGPHIISNSWGSSNQFGPLSAADQALAAAIATAVANGIIVCFSAGNGHWGFPGQHPDVISAGGVFMQPDGSMQASNYASGFASNIYPGRNVPDACGLVGMLPRAAYIMLPLQPGDQIDVDLASGGAFPNGDQTAPNDGWAAISGTSAASPQLAGVCALIRQACGRLTPPEVRDILKSTARDVTVGNCNANTGGNAAGPGPDLATGYGLVDANKAVLVAKVRCLRLPIGPIVIPPPPPQPVPPPVISPTPIVSPPIINPGPINPGPIIPPGPEPPPIVGPPPPIDPAAAPQTWQAPAAPQQAGGLSDEDVNQLEEMIREHGGDVDI